LRAHGCRPEAIPAGREGRRAKASSSRVSRGRISGAARRARPPARVYCSRDQVHFETRVYTIVPRFAVSGALGRRGAGRLRGAFWASYRCKAFWDAARIRSLWQPVNW
jgi:hypothetical protein